MIITMNTFQVKKSQGCQTPDNFYRVLIVVLNTPA